MYKKIGLVTFLLLVVVGIKAQEAFKLGGDTDTSTVIDFSNPKEYEIAGITVSGADHLDKNVLTLLSGLSIGDKVEVPGTKFSNAIENLWKQGLFEDVKITATKIQGKNIFINIAVEERPRLDKFALRGMTKSEADDLREKIKLIRGRVVTDNIISSTVSTVKEYFADKSYSDVKVTIIKDQENKEKNSVVLMINVVKGRKVKIKNINFTGNHSIKTWKLRKKFDETKRKRWWNPFNNGKFDEGNYEKDKKAIIAKYNEKGFRDAKIVSDTIYRANYKIKYHGRDFRKARRASIFKVRKDATAPRVGPVKYFKGVWKNLSDDKIVNKNAYSYFIKKKTKILWNPSFRKFRIIRDTNSYRRWINIDVTISEGNKYYFRNISWVGNSKYSTKDLQNVLSIKKGDTYDQSMLDARLYMNPNGNDVQSLYMDEGYLFFNISPVESVVSVDSIDIEMRIFEGKQATINKVSVVGNTKTNDHVVMREIRTRPGQLFRRSDIIRSQRELSQLGYFDPEKMNVVPTPNQATGTVDIEYTVEEKPSDQIELSGGYGGGRIVGTLGVTFNNFSGKNFFKKGAWRPLPSGDGQRLSVRAQSNGLWFQSYNISFTEPWLGGKKPNSLSVTAYYSIQSNGERRKIKQDGVKVVNPNRYSLDIFGVSVGLGKRLKKPDDYFSIFHELNYQYYVINNYGSIFSFSNGYANNIYYKAAIQRNSLQGNPIFPSGGSTISLSGQWTPPYSYFNNLDYNNITDQQRYKFVEYQKYKITTTFYTPITNKRGTEGKEARNLILRTSAGLGFLTSYNKKAGQSPFERFYLGGSGLTGFALDGREIIALRGYDDQTFSGSRGTGASYIAKYTAELRFPITLNPQATIFALAFTEAGNAWDKSKDFNPFKMYRSAGVGVRVFLPMFGLLGFDYGWRLDDVPSNLGMQKGQFHFTIGASIGEL